MIWSGIISAQIIYIYNCIKYFYQQKYFYKNKEKEQKKIIDDMLKSIKDEIDKIKKNKK